MKLNIYFSNIRAGDSYVSNVIITKLLLTETSILKEKIKTKIRRLDAILENRLRFSMLSPSVSSLTLTACGLYRARKCRAASLIFALALISSLVVFLLLRSLFRIVH